MLTEPKMSTRYDEHGLPYPKSWWFRTLRHPILTEIYDRFYTVERYRTGRKVIPNNISDDLDAHALAIWIMDDGSYNRGVIDISTYSFTENEVQSLQNAIVQNFGVTFRYHRDRDKGYRMYANQTETKKLVRIIQPHVIPSMMYKIGSH